MNEETTPMLDTYEHAHPPVKPKNTVEIKISTERLFLILLGLSVLLNVVVAGVLVYLILR